MPKMKSHKGIKKAMRTRPGGTAVIGRPGSRHKTGKKSAVINRKNRAGSTLSKADEKRLKSLI